ncbi:M48 family metallopeptidase [Arcobacter sp. FWKO B]|uniref:M48 family metallopeptidase n=1 Tax=Arcobacter sp. FWKO B TaxID=2593672 RepID=UPI0018A4AD68|nr:M48 family metallopeptidase [Arcobacter sp. FWKO B]QOG12756.1 M48 family metallopeptidase [Arcobacter sp. FWKO B]
MLELLMMAYCYYLFINVYVSFMQVDYVKKALKAKPVILDEKNYKVAGEYAIEKEKVSIVSNLYDFVIFIVWIFFGLKFLDSVINIDNTILKAVIFIDIFIVVNWLLGLPFSLYMSFKLDKKYGFSNMTPELYIKDTLKTGILFLVFGSLVIAGVAYIIDTLPMWWVWGFAFIFGVIILINMLYPVIRDKMFDKFEPLQDKELEGKIENLLSSVGFKSSGVFSVDASKRDNRLNAYFGGLGSTKRVVLFDTLIKKLSHNELLAVLGHELGHFKNGDIVKNIAIMGVVMFVFFALFGNLTPEVFFTLGLLEEPSSVMALFLIFSTPLSFFLMPLISFISRKNEYAADEFGSNLQTKEDLVSALLKLVNENKSFPLAHKYYVFFHYSHPPLIQRLKELGHHIETPDVENIG